MLNIDLAISHYNTVNADSIISGKLPKLIRADLATMVYPDVARETAAQYLSGAAVHGNKLDSDKVRKICEITGVDANFLFGIPQMKGIIR